LNESHFLLKNGVLQHFLKKSGKKIFRRLEFSGKTAVIAAKNSAIRLKMRVKNRK